MRFPDGAIRPAYNAQIAAAPKEGVIVSVGVTDRRNDAGLAEPMVDDIARRYGQTPDRLLVDTSYATSDDIVALAAHAAGPVSVYTPPPNLFFRSLTPGPSPFSSMKITPAGSSAARIVARLSGDNVLLPFSRSAIVSRPTTALRASSA